MVDTSGRVVDEHRVDAPHELDTLVEAIRAGVDKLAHREVGALGVGAAGMVDDDGVVRYAPNLPMFVEAPLPRPRAGGRRRPRDRRQRRERRRLGGVLPPARCAGTPTACSSPSAPVSAAESSATAGCCAARTGSPRRSVTGSSTRRGRRVPVARSDTGRRWRPAPRSAARAVHARGLATHPGSWHVPAATRSTSTA